ncbi:hypothetical protein VTN77DRAFT_7079 [Rasamsonia byssochlamydoides]|uniref:uncharacterized protein n=1 Tax=Rasamsonia byssochlamydoides TaxID=89139 RepID=UPI0037449851
MASVPTSYSPRSSTHWGTAPIRSPVVDPDTPPPPPPKPSSHEASRRGTPLAGPPPPPPPPPSQSQEYQADSRDQSSGANAVSDAERDSSYYNKPDDAQAPLPEPPSIEDEWLPDIVKDKSTVELQSVLSNPSLISALSTLHPSYTASQQHLQSLLESNKALARHVLDLESRVASLRASTESLLLTHQSLEVSWRKKQAEMDAALAPWSPKALYQRLAAAVAEQEAVCRAVEESFLEGDHQLEGGRASDREVADWVRRVRTEAAKLEARREARARWDEGRVGGWR